MSAFGIVPKSKHDLASCETLCCASDAEVLAKAGELLPWLQDMNWPAATPVLNRIARLGLGLVHPVREVLGGADDVWKYWVVSALLPKSGGAVVDALKQELDRIVCSPTPGEVGESVVDAIQELRRGE